MSLEDRIEGRYMKLRKLSGWTTDKQLGENTSEGLTQVYLLKPRLLSSSKKKELKVLKAIELVKRPWKKSDSTPEQREEYQKEVEDRKTRAKQESDLMEALGDVSNVMNCDDAWEQEWEDRHSFGCDFLILMPYKQCLTTPGTRRVCVGPDQTIRVGRDIAAVLMKCHQQKIAHRDIKPDNIFMEDGHYLLGDFGISWRKKEEDHKASRALTKVFTRAYAPPEQQQLGVSYNPYLADIYSLGITLYVICNNGCLPFSDKPGYVSEDAMEKRLAGRDIPPPKNAAPELRNVILKACAYKPEDRYQSAEEMLRALEKIPGSGLEESASGMDIGTSRDFKTQGAEPGVQYHFSAQDRNRVGPTPDPLPTNPWKKRLLAIAATAVFLAAVSAAGLAFASSDGKEAPDITLESVKLLPEETVQLNLVENRKSITWISEDETVAAVDENGLVTAVGSGETRIIVRDKKDREDACVVTVAVQTLTMEPSSVEQIRGSEPVQLRAALDPADETAELRWFSSDETVAAVDETGLVTPVGSGECVITAACEDLSAECAVTVLPKPVEEVQVTPDAVTLDAGATKQLSAAVLPEDADAGEILWISSNESLASVDSSGLLTIAAGTVSKAETVTITASCGEKSGICTVTVRKTKETVPTVTEPTTPSTSTTPSTPSTSTTPSTPSTPSSSSTSSPPKTSPKPSVTSITINPDALKLKPGEPGKLTATISPSNATGTVKWTSSDTSVASVDGSGNVTAKGKGTATITASCDGQSDTATVTVDLPEVESVTLDQHSVKLDTNNGVQLTATVRPANTGQTVKWTSSDTSVASVSGSGYVIWGGGYGTATITASCGGKSDTCTIAVSRPYVSVTDVGIYDELYDNMSYYNGQTGETFILHARVYPSNATNQTISWSSSDSSVASVSQSGVVTLRGEGRATITASCVDGASDSMTVESYDPVPDEPEGGDDDETIIYLPDIPDSGTAEISPDGVVIILDPEEDPSGGTVEEEWTDTIWLN